MHSVINNLLLVNRLLLEIRALFTAFDYIEYPDIIIDKF
jgi:hypothetical protein